jgi:hypothetical protein
MSAEMLNQHKLMVANQYSSDDITKESIINTTCNKTSTNPTRHTPPRVEKVGVINHNKRNHDLEDNTNIFNGKDDDKSESSKTQMKGCTVVVEAFSVSDNDSLTTLNHETATSIQGVVEDVGGSTTSPGYFAYKKQWKEEKIMKMKHN